MILINEHGPWDLDADVLAHLVRASVDGVVVLDSVRRVRYVNAAGADILGRRPEDLIGRPSMLGPPAGPAVNLAPRCGNTAEHCSIPVGVPPEPREIEYTEFPISADGVAGGAASTGVIFRDVTSVRHQRYRIAAFSRTAANLAYAGSLTNTLDAVASEVVSATDVVACLIIPGTETGLDFADLGAAGLPDGYTTLARECERRGAVFPSYDAIRSRRVRVVPNHRDYIMTEPAMAPLRPLVRDADWDVLVYVPLLSRGRAVGVLNGFYARSRSPSDADIAFFGAMASQAAVAVENARLFAEVENRAMMDERHRLGRELHDSVSQTLFSTKLQTRALELALDREGIDHGTTAEMIADLKQLVQSALTEMRALIFELHPGTALEDGLVAAIRRRAATITSQDGVRTTVRAPRDWVFLGSHVEENLYRITCEAMHNIVKHARATTASIRLLPDTPVPGRIALEIADNGVGFAPEMAHPSKLGTASMRERVERLGGAFSIDSQVGQGTTVRMEIPAAATIHDRAR